MTNEIQAKSPISQSHLTSALLNHIHSKGQLFKKIETVHARLAQAGEVIVTTTAYGEEGHNVARDGDVVVRNQTSTQEMYIVKQAQFRSRYKVVSEPSSEWQEFEPCGEAHAIEITDAVTTQLNVGHEFFIEASWGETQFAAQGDYFVSPSPGFDEIYRVGKPEFEKTYAKKTQV